MATITHLKFDIGSNWNGKGLKEAQADLLKFSQQLRAMQNRNIRVKIGLDPEVDDEFEDRLQEQMRQRRVRVPVELEVDEARTERELERVSRNRSTRVRAEIDPAVAEEQLRSLLLRNQRLAIQVNADTALAQTQLSRLQGENRQLELNADLDAATAEARLQALRLRNRQLEMRIDADTAAAQAQIAVVARDRHVNLNVRANTGRSMIALVAMRAAAMGTAVAIGGITAAFFLLGQVGAMVGAALVGVLGGGLIAGALAGRAAIEKLTETHDKAARSAQRQADTAERALNSAYTNAARVAVQGAQRIATAERGVTSAARAAKDAREDLTQAYEDQRRAVQDLAMDLQGMAVDEESAVIAVERAMEAKRKLGQDGQPVSILDVREADNNIDQALQRLDQVRLRNQRLREDGQKAAQEGIEGSERVVDAKQKVADADQAAIDASQELAQTQADVAQANADAQQQIAEAQQQLADSQVELNAALEKQNGILAQAGRYFMEITEPMQAMVDRLMPAWRQRIDELKGPLTGLFTSAAGLMEPMVDGIFGFVSESLPGLTTALNNSRPTMEGFRDGVSRLGEGFGNMFQTLSGSAAALGDTWRVVGDGFADFFEMFGVGVAATAAGSNKSLALMFDGINAMLGGMFAGLAPALEAMAGGTSIWYSLFAGIGQFFAAAGPGIGQFTEALSGALGPAMLQLAGPLGSLFGQVLTSMVPVLNAVTPLIHYAAQGFAAILNWLGPLSPVLAGVAIGWWAINAAMAANPITLVVLAIAALVGGITYLATQTNFFQSLWAKIQPAVQSVIPAFQQFGQMMKDLFGPMIQGTVNAVKTAFSEMKNQWDTSLRPALVGLMNTLAPLWEQLKPILGAVGAAILALASGLWGAVNGAIGPILAFIGDTLTNIVNLVKGVIEFITGLLQTVKGLIGVFFGVFNVIVQAIRGLFTGDFGPLKGALSGLGNSFKEVFGGIGKMLQGVGHVIGALWDTIYSIVRRGVELVVGIVWGFVEGIINFFAWLYDVLVGHSIVPDLMDAIVSLFTSLPGKVMALVRFLVDGVIAAWQWLWDRVKDVASGIWDWLKGAWDTFFGAFKATLDFYIDAVRTVWDTAWNFVKDVVSGIWDWIQGRWDAFWSGIQSVLDTFVQKIREAWDKLWTWVKDFASDIWTKVTEGFDGLKTGITGILEGIVTKAGEIWNKIKGIFATPINFVIDIWNDKIADKIGLGDKKIPRIEGYADGGPIRGKGGSRADLVHAMVSPREYIVNAEAASRNRGVLDAINFGGAQAGVLPRFRDGGPVEWMTGWVQSTHPGMQVTSTYRNSADHHGSGKAVDFALPMSSAGIAGMINLASDIASTWGKETLELIHGNGFQGNIKDGRSVGDGMGFYGPGIMAEHNNHVHWAVPRPLDEQDRGGITGIITGAIDAARDLVSDIFKTATDPLIDAIPNPFAPGMGESFGAIPKQFAGSVRDNILTFIKGRESSTGVGGGDIGGLVPTGDRLKIIEEALRVTSTPPPDDKDAWLRGMNTLIERESGWRADNINTWDSNAEAGTPSKGLAQVIDPTFQSYKQPGYENIWDPVHNVAAAINYIKKDPKYGSIHAVQQANANLPKKGYADGTDRAKPGLAWVAEKGPELINDVLVGQDGPEVRDFKGGEQVTPFDQTIQRIKDVKLGERSAQAIGSFFKANFDQFTQDMTGGSIENGFLPQLIKQSMEYGQKLDAQGGVHFHVVDVDEALRKYKQMQREQTYGLM